MVLPTSVGGANALGMVTGDYTGSTDEWQDMVIADLIKNYKSGAGGMGGYGDGSIGQPNPADMGTPDKPLSYQTVKYWEDYVKKFGASDPWITSNYGAPPGRNATFETDPNSPAAITGSWKDRNAAAEKEAAAQRAFDASENAADRAVSMAGIASGERIAGMQEAGATARVQMQIEGSWREAMLADATRRYVAEGDWGVQKWVTTENNTAAMARLQVQLQFDREALAQQAIAEKNRHHEQMVGLALEVAKYDAELAASPRNWLKYAGWLQQRNIVVNGMTLAMAAQEVPEESITPATVANGTGSNVAGIETAQELASGASGGSASSQNAFGADTMQLTGAEGAAGPNVNVNTQNPTMNPMTPTPSAQDLSNTTDYAALARNLLGMNPLAPTEADVSPQNLQNISNNLRTAERPRIAGFGAGNFPTTNALGMQVNETMGKDVRYDQFANLLPTEQEMKVGEVASIRGDAGVSDWVAEMERSRPKGGGSSLAWG